MVSLPCLIVVPIISCPHLCLVIMGGIGVPVCADLCLVVVVGVGVPVYRVLGRLKVSAEDVHLRFSPATAGSSLGQLSALTTQRPLQYLHLQQSRGHYEAITGPTPPPAAVTRPL